ncbi:hypothetical protein MMC28_007927 [Mycoblastus sanguinarius]|nr:hypothetical protein [Mycoblastus sanguinarius]
MEQDRLSELPLELLLTIFSDLSTRDLDQFCKVSTNLKAAVLAIPEFRTFHTIIKNGEALQDLVRRSYFLCPDKASLRKEDFIVFMAELYDFSLDEGISKGDFPRKGAHLESMLQIFLLRIKEESNQAATRVYYNLMRWHATDRHQVYGWLWILEAPGYIYQRIAFCSTDGSGIGRECFRRDFEMAAFGVAVASARFGVLIWSCRHISAI